MRKAIIIGAAGRDFHNFNVFFRQNTHYEVVAFTAAQIPDIGGRTYPASLAGPRYPQGIPIEDERDLEALIARHGVHECFFAYSDVSYAQVMALCARVQAAGATFTLSGPGDTMIRAGKPVVAVCAVRTGCGKSPASRFLLRMLEQRGLRAVVVRHPMPYGNLEKQGVQRFARLADFEQQACTIEEMEEYEPYVAAGHAIYAGADYAAIAEAAVQDPDGCDVILWDGGNNDFPFFRPDLWITVTDPHRAGHEVSYYPGEVNLCRADVVLINKVDSAPASGIATVRENAERLAPNARIIETTLEITCENPGLLRGKRVLAVEDGPTLTHGGMKTGAATLAAQRLGAVELVDPRPWLRGSLAETYETYPGIGKLLPAMGYGPQQLADLEATINAVECDVVVIGTPIDLNRVISIRHPATRVFYELEEKSRPGLYAVLDGFLKGKGIG